MAFLDLRADYAGLPKPLPAETLHTIRFFYTSLWPVTFYSEYEVSLSNSVPNSSRRKVMRAATPVNPCSVPV